ncbi:unnamed protein product [Diatraea saccharalis]|uniref:Uncharacterized protein n=1 Tax=Diatraea saccharalis TaxID=40085 RepID=A0A9N9WAY0_9NEOP|nr:unnamed protein product [Diatraea saccharalis]
MGGQMFPLPPFFQSPPDGLPSFPPIPVPPQPPGLPPGLSPGLPAGLPTGSMPMMPMPMPVVGPAPKVPVIVMPFYSPDPAYKKPPGKKPPHFPKRPPRLPYYHSDTSADTDTSSDTSTSSDSSYENRGWWRGNRGFKRNGRRFNRRHRLKKKKHNRGALLTPVLQYVTKDGYVIYEKKITRDEAKDWMNIKRDMKNDGNENEQDMSEVRNIELQFQGLQDDEVDKDQATPKIEVNKEDSDGATTQQITARRHHKHKKMKLTNHQKQSK